MSNAMKQEPEGWTDRLAAHRPWLYAVIFARLRDAHAVEEVLQETALAASRRCHRDQKVADRANGPPRAALQAGAVTPSGKGGAIALPNNGTLPSKPMAAFDSDETCRWLYRVALRQCVLYRRRDYRHRHRETAFAQARNRQSGQDQCDPLQLLEASEDRILVRQAIGQLRHQDCEVLLLRYFEGWKTRQIAERLGFTVSAVKSRLLRARRNLRRQLLKLHKDWEY